LNQPEPDRRTGIRVLDRCPDLAVPAAW